MAEWQELLARLIRPTDAGAQPPLACPSPAEWSALIAGAPGALHPWLSYCVERRFAPGQVPATVTDALAQARRGAAVGHLRRQALVRRLLPALGAAGVTAVMLKGGALAHLSYPDPSLRAMDDLDLWVAPADLDRAVQAATAVGVGYTRRHRDRGKAEKDPEQAPTRVLESPEYGLVVEVHGVLASLECLSAQWLARAWSRRERRMLGDMQAWVMHPQDMLTHLAIHCSRHHHFDSGLRPLLDIALWLRSDGAAIDWPLLLREWEQEHVAVWALLPIQLASELLGAPVPAEVARRIEQTAGFDRLLETARPLVFGTVLTLPPTMARLVSSTPRDRLAWVFNRLTTWYWKGPPGSKRSAAQVLSDALRRMGHDLRYKTGPYFRALWQGHFWGADFRRRREVAVGRGRLATLVERIEPPAARSAAPSPTHDEH